MTAREYLSQAKEITSSLRSMAIRVQTLREALVNTNPSVCDIDMPRSPSPNVHRMESLVVAKLDMENEIETKSAILAEISRTVHNLPNQLYSSILSARYFAGMEWAEIAKENHVSVSRIYQIHKEALAAIEKSIADYSWL